MVSPLGNLFEGATADVTILPCRERNDLHSLSCSRGAIGQSRELQKDDLKKTFEKQQIGIKAIVNMLLSTYTKTE
jgi:hypothetical protein